MRLMGKSGEYPIAITSVQVENIMESHPNDDKARRFQVQIGTSLELTHCVRPDAVL